MCRRNLNSVLNLPTWRLAWMQKLARVSGWVTMFIQQSYDTMSCISKSRLTQRDELPSFCTMHVTVDQAFANRGDKLVFDIWSAQHRCWTAATKQLGSFPPVFYIISDYTWSTQTFVWVESYQRPKFIWLYVNIWPQDPTTCPTACWTIWCLLKDLLGEHKRPCCSKSSVTCELKQLDNFCAVKCKDYNNMTNKLVQNGGRKATGCDFM